MTVPGRPALFVAALLALALLGAVVEASLVYVALAGDAALVAICLIEGYRLKRMGVSVQRESPRRLQLGRKADFIYVIENRDAAPRVVLVRQSWPDGFACETNTLEVTVQGGETVRAALSATPSHRGRARLPAMEVDVRFPRGLARRRWDAQAGQAVSIYPDLRRLREYDALRRSRGLTQFGVHHQRQLGHGREFEELRQYLPDDDFRDINWKATARSRQPVTNVYRAERSRDVLLCLDCSRMMGTPVGDKTALDRAVDATVTLMHVATRQGDNVGLVTFRDTVGLFLKPSRTAQASNRILEELVDLAAEPVFPSYAAFAQSVRVCHKRRSLLFLFTDLNDPQLASDLARTMPLLSHRHVVVAVSLRDPLPAKVANGPARAHDDLHRVLAARALVSERDARARDLVRQGVHVIECDADSLGMNVINRYLAIRSRQLL